MQNSPLEYSSRSSRATSMPLFPEGIILTARTSHIVPRSSDTMLSISSKGYDGVLVIGMVLVGGAFFICLCQWAVYKISQHCYRLRSRDRRWARTTTSDKNTSENSPDLVQSPDHAILLSKASQHAGAVPEAMQVQRSIADPIMELCRGSDIGTIVSISRGRYMSLPCSFRNLFQGTEICGTADPSIRDNETTLILYHTTLYSPLAETFTPSPQSSESPPSPYLAASTTMSLSPRSTLRLSLPPLSSIPSHKKSSTTSPAISPQSYPLPPAHPPPSYYTSFRRGASRSIRALRSIGTLNSEHDITTPLPEYRAASVPPYEIDCQPHDMPTDHGSP